MTKLDRYFEQQGLAAVSAHVKRASPMLAFYGHDVNMMVVEEGLSMYAKRPGADKEKVNHVRRLIEDAKREKQQGMIWDYPRYQVVGQKPL